MTQEPHVFYPAVPLSIRKEHEAEKILGAWTNGPLIGHGAGALPESFEVYLWLEGEASKRRWVREAFQFTRRGINERTGDRTFEGAVFLNSRDLELPNVAEWFIFNRWRVDEVPEEVKQRVRPTGADMPREDTIPQEALIPRLREFCNDADALLRARELRRNLTSGDGGAETTFDQLREKAKSLIDHVRRHYNAASSENVPHGWGERSIPRRTAGTGKELDREEGLKGIQGALLPIVLNWPDEPSREVVTRRRVKAIRDGMRLLGRGLGLESPPFIGTRLVSTEVVTHGADSIFGPRKRTGIVVTPRVPTKEEEAENTWPPSARKPLSRGVDVNVEEPKSVVGSGPADGGPNLGKKKRRRSKKRPVSPSDRPSQVPDSAMLTHRSVAELSGRKTSKEVEAVRKALDRWREDDRVSKKAGRDYIENPDRSKGEPIWLYRWGAVRRLFEVSA